MPKITLVKSFPFEAGHFIPGHPQCGGQHGHSFLLKVSIEGETRDDGFVMDFHDLKGLVHSYVVDKIDHKNLNDSFAFPSCENIVIWMWEQLKGPLALSGVTLKRIKLYETRDSCACYYGK
jgi:6-pyruvoyltetrahydropterin/6-carboxytetrahydropterin synthase